MEVKKIVKYEYIVTDIFGREEVFTTKTDAIKYEKKVDAMRKLLSCAQPKGVTLVVSKNKNVWFKVIPAFICANGVPFTECDKDKSREFFHGRNPFSWHDGIYGGIVDVLKKSLALTKAWKSIHGNDTCGFVMCPCHWNKGALWYSWDGENFLTNDHNCKITNNDF